MHYTNADLTWTDAGEGWTIARVELAKGDTAWNPASSKAENAIHGPAVVTYHRSRASITAYVDDPA
jgi:hypothetical protein